MKKSVIFSTFMALLAFPVASYAEFVGARLTGFQEVPSVATGAQGDFRARINPDDQSIDYELNYGGLQGNVRQAHIHFAQRHVNGSIVVWLCGTASNPGPAGTQLCPQTGSITGTITAANVIATSNAAQQVNAGDLDTVIAAMRARAVYVNVHTDASPGGEIRGQIRASRRGRN